MTIVATGVGDRVTDLTGKFLAVNLMHRVCVATGSSCRMTIHTLRRFHSVKAVGFGGLHVSRGSVQFSTRMTLDTVHARFAEMHIAGDALILAEEFVTHTAAVTCGTGAGHRRGLFKDMSGEQSTAYVLRLADVALATGGVAGGTVIAKHLFDGWVVFGDFARAGIERCPIALLAVMKRKFIGGCHVAMTVTTTIFFRLRTGAGDHPLVCNCLVRRRSAAMTFGTGNLTVCGGQEGTCIN